MRRAWKFSCAAFVRLLALGTPLWALAACSMDPMLLSQPVLQNDPNKPQQVGTLYYLPKSVLRLTIKSYGRAKQVPGKEDPIASPEVIVIDSANTRTRTKLPTPATPMRCNTPRASPPTIACA